MDILIQIFFGSMVGWIVTKGPYKRTWNVAFGSIGALSSSQVMQMLGLPGATGYNFYSFLVAMIGAVIVIHISRSLERFPQTKQDMDLIIHS